MMPTTGTGMADNPGMMDGKKKKMKKGKQDKIDADNGTMNGPSATTTMPTTTAPTTPATAQ